MITVKELRQYCEKLLNERKEDVKSALNDYFENAFIAAHRPFTAVIGNENFKPIQLDNTSNFLLVSEEKVSICQIGWPNISEELIRKELEKLGFVLEKDCLSVSVPSYKEGAKLSFAQEWAEKINSSYSEYCANEEKKANEIYSEFISELFFSTPTMSLKAYEEFILFSNFHFSHKVSSECETFIKKLMARDGIEEYYENGNYKGIKVYLKQPSL